jgi:hypothetical protein
MDLTKEKDINTLLDLHLLYEPLAHDVVLNKPSEEELKKMGLTASGLTISNDPNKIANNYVHTVLAVGPECKHIKLGDRVLLRESGPKGHPMVKIEGKWYVQVSEFVIYGKIKNESKKDTVGPSGILL